MAPPDVVVCGVVLVEVVPESVLCGVVAVELVVVVCGAVLVVPEPPSIDEELGALPPAERMAVAPDEQRRVVHR